MLRNIAVVVAATASVLVPLSTPATARTCAPGPPPATSPIRPPGVDAPLTTTRTSIHWTRVSERVTSGEAAALEGQVVTEDGAVTSADVDLLERRRGDSGWSLVASTTSDPDSGVFAFGCLVPEWTTSYRVAYAGTLTYAASQSTREVAVARRMPDSMRQVSPSRFVYSGSVAPRYAGRVTLQRRSCPACAWKSVATDPTDDRSRWRFVVDVSRLRGKPAYRATIPAHDRFARSFSDHVWRVTVR